MNNDNRIKTAGELAGDYFKNGLCCSEAVFKAALDVFAPGYTKELVRLATGFCGGMGDRSGPCGVHSGAIMAIGYFTGRDEPGASDRLCRELSASFSNKFLEMNREIVCKDLLHKMRWTNWNKRGCRKLTVAGAEILAGIIISNNLTPPGQ
ncbi:MAG: C_GCAxxG_C_C family protein [Nitrospirae bacterium]|nr:C_GCAxxG_C_C family protein [Nitrospirota bacterium]